MSYLLFHSAPVFLCHPMSLLRLLNNNKPCWVCYFTFTSAAWPFRFTPTTGAAGGAARSVLSSRSPSHTLPGSGGPRDPPCVLSHPCLPLPGSGGPVLLKLTARTRVRPGGAPIASCDTNKAQCPFPPSFPCPPHARAIPVAGHVTSRQACKAFWFVVRQ